MYSYDTWTEFFDNSYWTYTKVYDNSINRADFSGCHWDNPAVVACEQVKGVCMSEEMSKFIDSIHAIDDDTYCEFLS